GIHAKGEAGSNFSTLESAMLGLLALMLAFTFSRDSTLTGNLPRDFKFSSWGWVAKRLQHATIGSSMTETGRQVAVVVYVVVMVAIIVGVDFAFFRNHFWERLTVNIGIVLVFAAFYWRFLSRN
ncbi:MAG: hypothetical protein WCB61_27085, partial [Pseudolabrys sp.]